MVLPAKVEFLRRILRFRLSPFDWSASILLAMSVGFRREKVPSSLKLSNNKRFFAPEADAHCKRDACAPVERQKRKVFVKINF